MVLSSKYYSHLTLLLHSTIRLDFQRFLGKALRRRDVSFAINTDDSPARRFLYMYGDDTQSACHKWQTCCRPVPYVVPIQTSCWGYRLTLFHPKSKLLHIGSPKPIASRLASTVSLSRMNECLIQQIANRIACASTLRDDV